MSYIYIITATTSTYHLPHLWLFSLRDLNKYLTEEVSITISVFQGRKTSTGRLSDLHHVTQQVRVKLGTESESPVSKLCALDCLVSSVIVLLLASICN